MTELDDLDYQILKVLMKDGQITNVDLSKLLGTSVNTVRNRIQRMVEGNVLRIVGITNPLLIGFDVHVIMGVDVEFNHLASAAKGFAELNAVRYVAYASGEHNLVVMAFFQNMEQYFDFLMDRVAKMEGILSIKVMFVGEEIKRNYDYVAHIEEIKKLNQSKETPNDH